MGLSASQGRLLLLTAKQSDLEFRAQQISQKRLVLAQQLEEISKDYEDATSNRVMSIALYQKGDDADKAIQTSANLTYKNLISGTVADSTIAASAGIQASSAAGTKSLAATSNRAYRLVDTSGAIVISDKSEIPSKYTNYTKKTSPAEAVENGKYSNVFKVTNKNENDEVVSEKNYIVLKKPTKQADGTYKGDTALATALGADFDTKEAEFGVIKKADGTGETPVISYGGKWYDMSGNEITDKTTADYTFTSAGKAKFAENRPQSVSYDSQSFDYTITPGNDGLYTLKDAEGNIIQRYRVDTGLKGGSNAADPNYLQDCIRNGKYLIEQYSENKDDLGGPSWDKVSWDATSNISDRYFNEDDATAKATYDRKQNEIQNADKKLELELDNVESQRNAVKTEIESVEKVINDNVEKSFKTFA